MTHELQMTINDSLLRRGKHRVMTSLHPVSSVINFLFYIYVLLVEQRSCPENKILHLAEIGRFTEEIRVVFKLGTGQDKELLPVLHNRSIYPGKIITCI